MRRNHLFVAVVTLAVVGAAGLVVVSIAMVAQTLSVGWALLAGVAAALVAASAGLAVVVAVRRGPHVASRVVARPVEVATAQQTKEIERAVVARLGEQEKTLRKVFEVRLEQHARRTRKEIDSVYSQLEALHSLHLLLEPGRPLPPLRRWAVSPDLALHVLKLVFDGTVRTVLETGSGASTVLLGMALDKTDAGRIVSLEHDPQYAAATRRMLREHGVEHRATVIDAPLAEVTLDDETFRWYDLAGADLPSGVDLLLIDGPPEATGHQARYPALPLLRHTLSQGALVILDDGDRAGEQEIAQRWANLAGVGEPVALSVERSAIQLVVGSAGS